MPLNFHKNSTLWSYDFQSLTSNSCPKNYSRIPRIKLHQNQIQSLKRKEKKKHSLISIIFALESTSTAHINSSTGSDFSPSSSLDNSFLLLLPSPLFCSLPEKFNGMEYWGRKGSRWNPPLLSIIKYLFLKNHHDGVCMVVIKFRDILGSNFD